MRSLDKDEQVVLAEFVVKEWLEDEKQPARAHRLDEGDIFTLKNELTVQFETNVFHEVKFSGYDEYMQSIWSKTGKIFSAEELNEYSK